jgi:hypothetical protein
VPYKLCSEGTKWTIKPYLSTPPTTASLAHSQVCHPIFYRRESETLMPIPASSLSRKRKTYGRWMGRTHSADSHALQKLTDLMFPCPSLAAPPCTADPAPAHAPAPAEEDEAGLPPAAAAPSEDLLALAWAARGPSARTVSSPPQLAQQ